MDLRLELLFFLTISVLISGVIWEATSSDVYANTSADTITPTKLNATAVSPTQIDLAWLPPTQNYGKTIIGYKIEEELGSGVFFVLLDNTQSTNSMYAVTGLKTGTTYTFRVSAVYSDDTTTDPSKPASATPLITSTPPQTSSTAPPTNVKFDFTPSDGTTLSGVVLTNIDYQQLQFRKDSRSVISSPAHTSQPVNNDIVGVLRYENNHQALPTVPGPLIATPASPTQIDLFWNPPSETFGQTIIGYKIEWKQASGAYVAIEDNTRSIDTKYSVYGLKTGTTYTYRVFAIFADDTISNPSNEASATPLLASNISNIPAQNNTSAQTNTSTTQSQAPAPQQPTNVRFDFTSADGSTLSGVILTQAEYQQLIVIKDPRSIISNVSQTESTINNDLAGLLKYQTIHTPQPSSAQTYNYTPPPPTTSAPLDIRVVEGVVTSVIAMGVMGIVTWLVRTKLAKNIAKEYYFTLEKFDDKGIKKVMIRNSGPTIEDCVILCEKETCYWDDNNINKPRHVFEGSLITVRLPEGYELTNPLITVKNGKRILRKIRLDDMAHG